MGAVLRVSDGVRTITHDLERFRANTNNMKPALERVAQVQADAVRDQFRTQGRHYGTRWAALSPAYKSQKTRSRPGRPILLYNGKLKKHVAPVLARNAGIYQVTGKRMEIGVAYSQVPYAQFHQEGTATMPARPILGTPTRADQKAMVKEIHRWIVNGLEVLR